MKQANVLALFADSSSSFHNLNEDVKKNDLKVTVLVYMRCMSVFLILYLLVYGMVYCILYGKLVISITDTAVVIKWRSVVIKCNESQ